MSISTKSGAYFCFAKIVTLLTVRVHALDTCLCPSPKWRDLKRFRLMKAVPPTLWLTVFIQLDRPSPSLHSHYRSFITTTGESAPVPCMGTLTGWHCHLSFSPCHQDDRFSCSIPKPVLSSCHLHADCHFVRFPVHVETHPGNTLGSRF